jgi:DNA adenine methylase
MKTRHYSPLRYPGGKASLAGFIGDVIVENELSGCRYFEPYAGGAGVALALLSRGVVSDVNLNDADWRVYCFWEAVLNQTDKFVDKVSLIDVSIDEWHHQRAVSDSPKAHSPFEVGFSAFYLNRCNRSGVLTGAGPIGGIEQSGVWKLNARFNKEALIKRMLMIKEMRHNVSISNKDAIEFLKSELPRGNSRKNVFVYLDPPYVVKGQRLYLNSYSFKDHVHIARYLQKQATLPWILSYDDTVLVRDLYSKNRMYKLPVNYSLQVKKTASELLISPKQLKLPPTDDSNGCLMVVTHGKQAR